MNFSIFLCCWPQDQFFCFNQDKYEIHYWKKIKYDPALG